MKKFLSLLLLLSWSVGLQAAQGGQQKFWHGIPLDALTILDKFGFPAGLPNMPKANIRHIIPTLYENIVFGRLQSDNQEVEIPDYLILPDGRPNGGELSDFIRSVLNLRNSTRYHPMDPRDYFVNDPEHKINQIVRAFTLDGAQQYTFSQPTELFLSGQRRTTFKMPQLQVQPQPQPQPAAAAAQAAPISLKEKIVQKLREYGVTAQEYYRRVILLATPKFGAKHGQYQGGNRENDKKLADFIIEEFNDNEPVQKLLTAYFVKFPNSYAELFNLLQVQPQPAAAAQAAPILSKEQIVQQLKNAGLTAEQFNQACIFADQGVRQAEGLISEEGKDAYRFDLIIDFLKDHQGLIKSYFEQKVPNFEKLKQFYNSLKAQQAAAAAQAAPILSEPEVVQQLAVQGLAPEQFKDFLLWVKEQGKKMKGGLNDQQKIDILCSKLSKQHRDIIRQYFNQHNNYDEIIKLLPLLQAQAGQVEADYGARIGLEDFNDSLVKDDGSLTFRFKYFILTNREDSSEMTINVPSELLNNQQKIITFLQDIQKFFGSGNGQAQIMGNGGYIEMAQELMRNETIIMESDHADFKYKSGGEVKLKKRTMIFIPEPQPAAAAAAQAAPEAGGGLGNAVQWVKLVEEAVKDPALNTDFAAFWKKINDDYVAKGLKMSERGKYNLIKKKIEQSAQPEDIKNILLDGLKEEMIRQCPVCLAVLDRDNVSNLKTSVCGHIGHEACLNEWFKKSKQKKCPVCIQAFTTQKEIDFNKFF